MAKSFASGRVLQPHQWRTVQPVIVGNRCLQQLQNLKPIPHTSRETAWVKQVMVECSAFASVKPPPDESYLKEEQSKGGRKSTKILPDNHKERIKIID